MPPRGPQFQFRKPNPATQPAAPSAASLSNSSADLPELIVEWMPNAPPNASDGVWVALPYVVSGSTSRGRKYELDQFGAGTLTLVLQILDRALTGVGRMFDPEYTAGPYYGLLTPMRQIRVSAKWLGTIYPIWRGYATSWGQTTVQDAMFETTITAHDAFERLEQIKLPSSAWALEIQKDNPDCWLRLGETNTTRVSDSSPGGNYGVYDNCQQGATGLIPNDADGAAAFAHSLEERVVIQNPNLISGYPFTVSAMIQVEGSDPGGEKFILAGITNIAGSPQWGTWMAIPPNAGTGSLPTPGLIDLRVRPDASNTLHVPSTVRVDDNQPHHVVGRFSTATDWAIFIDGQDVTGTPATTGTPSWAGSPPGGWVVGNFPDLLQGDYGFGANADGLGADSQQVHRGTIDEVCVWDGLAVTADRIAAQALAAFGWVGDDTGIRVVRFLDAINWSAELRDIDTGISILGPAGWSAGASALSVLQAWADTELGQFFVGKDGKLIWRSRHAPLLDLNSTRSRAAFGDAISTAPIKIDDDGLTLIRDATQIRNPVSAGRTNGISVTVSDDDLIDNTYGARAWASPITEDSLDSVVRDRAMWLLARYKNERLRLPSMTVNVREQPNYWGQVLDLEIGDRVTVQRTPLKVGNETHVDQIIEGIDWAFDGFSLTPTFAGSPVDPNVGSYLILDDEVYGLLDAGQLAY